MPEKLHIGLNYINKAVRFIFKVPRRSHITPYLKKVHFLPLNYRIRYKVCLLAYKIFHLSSPGYLAQHFKLYQPSTALNLRQVGRDSFMFDTVLCDYKKTSLISGIKIEWNSLPLEIRNEQFKSIFKIKLKTFILEAISKFMGGFGICTHGSSAKFLTKI